MKIKSEYILQHIADQWVVIDVNARSVNFNNILSLNPSGRLLWEKLEAGVQERELVSALTERFGIDRETAEKDVTAFLKKLRGLGCLDE